MSYEVERWVWSSCTVQDDFERLLLLAIAWHCPRDDGTGAEVSQQTLCAMVRVTVKPLRAAIRKLEAAGELLVWRPVARNGLHRATHRYAVVMGRPVDDVRRLVEEPHRPAPRPPAPATEPTGATERTAQHVATARPTRSGRGQGEMGERLGSSERDAPQDLDLDLRRRRAAPASPARADDPLPDFQQLRQALGAIADQVSWQMTSQQAAAVQALVAVHGARRLAELALDAVSAKGPPTFARAWLGDWKRLPVPGDGRGHVVAVVGAQRSAPEGRVVPAAQLAARAACRSCDRHRGGQGMVEDDDGLPLHRCPTCHPSAVLEPAF